jgi:predicted hotdog family 3-hydroxylacyl-ACP dehydratase
MDLLRLVPHRPPMLLLDGADAGGAFLTVDPGAWYAGPGGAMPGWIGLEVMAQAVAAFQGRGGAPRRGYLVGTRSYRSAASFPAGALLRVRVGVTDEDPSGLATFACEILLDGETAASAILMVILK